MLNYKGQAKSCRCPKNPRKSHGPRYGLQGKNRSWVTRDSEGKFKDWTGKKKSLAADNAQKARCTPLRPGFGDQGDY